MYQAEQYASVLWAARKISVLQSFQQVFPSALQTVVLSMRKVCWPGTAKQLAFLYLIRWWLKIFTEERRSFAEVKPIYNRDVEDPSLSLGIFFPLLHPGRSQVSGFSSARAKTEGCLWMSGRDLRYKYKWPYWDFDTFAFQLIENIAMRRTCLGFFHLPIWRRRRKKPFISWQHVWKLEMEWLFNVFGFWQSDS